MKKIGLGKTAIKTVAIVAAVFFALYLILANFLVSACLVPDAGHGQTQDKDPERYFGTIESFIGKYCGTKV